MTDARAITSIGARAVGRDNNPLGNVAVLVFFSISGFSIAQSFDRTPSVRHFRSARALRLFPALWVMLVLTIPAGAALATAGWATYTSDSVTYILRNGLIWVVRNPLAGVFTDSPYPDVVNGSLWTLRHEVTCYAIVLVLGLFRLPGRWSMAMIAVLLAWLSIAGIEGSTDSVRKIWPAKFALVLPLAILSWHFIEAPALARKPSMSFRRKDM